MLDTIRRAGYGGVTPNPYTGRGAAEILAALLSALDLAKAGKLKEVMIVGFDENEDLIIRSSKTTNRDALWAAEVLRKYAMGDYDED